jgi:YebC/PmpR family DNA-binding regulatory protein
MAGHSHWANIARKKAIVDNKRGKLWSKLSRYIIIAARNGGGDPETNLKLRYAIDKARAVSMPKDNIDRAIKRGTGELQGEILEELQYEGFGPGNVAVLVDVVTDNRNRTLGDIRKIFEKGGGKMGSAGSVAHLFERRGVFVIPAAGLDEDQLLSIVLDAGAEDLKRQGEHFEVTTTPDAYSAVQAALEAAQIKPASSELTYVGKITSELDVETGRKLLKLLDALDDYDDVQAVYSTAAITEEMANASD